MRSFLLVLRRRTVFLPAFWLLVTWVASPDVDAQLRSEPMPASERGVQNSGPAQPVQSAEPDWQEFDLRSFTSRITDRPNPERVLVEWILDATGQDVWHGAEVAVLSASQDRIRVFHYPEVRDEVASIVDRFTNPYYSTVPIRMQLISTTNLDWRSNLIHLLKPLSTGAEGQQVWIVEPEDAALVWNRIQVDRNLKVVIDKRFQIPNGMSESIDATRPRNYVASQELASGTYLAYQPVVGRIDEGFKLQVQPLWYGDGSGIDLNLKVRTTAVDKVHSSAGRLPLNNSNQATSVQVPETRATVLEERVTLGGGKVLMISLGVQPGVVAEQKGIMPLQLSLPFSRGSEVLLFVRVEQQAYQPMASRSDGRRSDGRYAERYDRGSQDRRYNERQVDYRYPERGSEQRESRVGEDYRTDRYSSSARRPRTTESLQRYSRVPRKTVESSSGQYTRDDLRYQNNSRASEQTRYPESGTRYREGSYGRNQPGTQDQYSRSRLPTRTATQWRSTEGTQRR